MKPIPSDTPPGKVLEMARAQGEGIKGLRASVRVTVQAEGKAPQGFDAVLYAMRPDRVRLTGLAFMGFTAFDVVLTAEKFYFYQPSEGYLYSGARGKLRGFLAGRGVKADPEVIYRFLFFDTTGKYFYDSTADGYNLYLVKGEGAILTPLVKSEFDQGLNLKKKVFYDELARPYLYVESEGVIEEGGFRLPGTLKVSDTENGYTVTVVFEKYLVNPEGIESDFTIEGGEFKGIMEVE